MSDQQSPEDWRRERALAALSRAMRGEDDLTPDNLPARQKSTPRPSAVQVSTEPPEKIDHIPSENIRQKQEVRLQAETPEEKIPAADTVLSMPKLPATTLATLQEVMVEAPPAPANLTNEAVNKKDMPEATALVRPGMTASRPLILRLTLLGALVGIAAALLLWKSYGAIAAFLPLAGLLSGLGAGLVAALFQPKIVASAHEPTQQPNHMALGHPPTTDEIRASLRQFRAATQDLARSRTPR